MAQKDSGWSFLCTFFAESTRLSLAQDRPPWGLSCHRNWLLAHLLSSDKTLTPLENIEWLTEVWNKTPVDLLHNGAIEWARWTYLPLRLGHPVKLAVMILPSTARKKKGGVWEMDYVAFGAVTDVKPKVWLFPGKIVTLTQTRQRLTEYLDDRRNGKSNIMRSSNASNKPQSD